MAYAIRAEGLVKRYGDTLALDRVDLAVPAGTVLALLGPNGSGKSTALDVLTGRLRPDAGTAEVAGCDVLDAPERIGPLTGYAGRYAPVDGTLSVLESLTQLGARHFLSRRGARARAGCLLERFGLTGDADRQVGALSTGMRRRLGLAASLVGRPRVLFLDEPTAGLDPHVRRTVREEVRALVADGSSVLLATQDAAEADRLADRVTVLDRGRVVADGLPGELRRAVGDPLLHVRPTVRADGDEVARILAELTGAVPADTADTGWLGVPADNPMLLSALVRRLDRVGITADELGLRLPGLDEVVRTLTAPAGP